MSHSHIYDNWERLVAAVIKKQQLWELFHAHSTNSSFSSVSTDFTYTFSGRNSFDLSSDQLGEEFPIIDNFSPIRLDNKDFDPFPEPTNATQTSRAAFRFGVPTNGFAWYRKKIIIKGVSRFKNSEIEFACEDFSNVIGASPTATLYKGSLSSGVEVAVASYASYVAAELWSNSSEVQFRKKIKTLSKVNHKNFVNIIGYCAEDKPLRKMMVFEYVPNGTLFEHLHIKEAERIDWATRLRIAMGMAYFLMYMHESTPPLAIRDMDTSNVCLTEDYAAKVSEIFTWDEGDSSTATKSSLIGNVYSFGIILFEMVTGKHPHIVGSSYNWNGFHTGSQPLREMVDPTLETFREDQIEEIDRLIKSCADSDPKKRPRMREVCEWLYMITAIGPDEASPKHLPVEEVNLEIMSIYARD